MTITPEIPKSTSEIPVSEGQEKSGELEKKVEIPEHIEKGGVGILPQPSGAVDDTAQVTSQSAAPAVTITIPADQADLQSTAKGSPTNAITWLANFWLRIVKKAMHFGWQVVTKQDKSESGKSPSLSEELNLKDNQSLTDKSKEE